MQTSSATQAQAVDNALPDRVSMDRDGFRIGQRGFSLIEVLMAIGVLGIILPALVLGLITATRVLVMTDVRETARDLAQAQMEYVQAQPYADPPDYLPLSSAEVPEGYAVFLSSSRLDRGLGTDNDTGIQHVTILINRESTGEELFMLEGQKVRW
jgi:prepilin-type N-terminal cleavage/methylation domain-containing protein